MDSAGQELFLAEYATLREESAHARQAQQSTLTWSIAAIAAVFAGGLVFVGTVIIPGKPILPSAVAFYGLVFGLAIPGYAFFAALTYIGELGRMERAGAYLRAMESRVAGMEVRPYAPIRWETMLAFGKKDTSGLKLMTPVIGAMGLYGGSLLVSAVAFWAGTAMYIGVAVQYVSSARSFTHVLLPALFGPAQPLKATFVNDVPGFVAWIIVFEVVIFVGTMLPLLVVVTLRSRNKFDYDLVDPGVDY